MAPATGWHENDYWRASRAARKAWQATNQQLDMTGLDEGDAARWEAADGGSVVPSPSSTPECLPRDGRKVDAAVCSGVINDNRPR